MKPKGIPSPAVLFLSSTALANVIILLATMYRAYAPEKPYVFSYIGREYPLEVPTGPVPTVEMTFQESMRFGLADNTSAPNWDTLVMNQFGIGFHHIGPFHHRYISAAYHALHCVYSMGRDMEKPNHLTDTSHHLVHCMMYMRQLFMCNADATLEPGDFMARNLSIDRMGVTCQCRDWRTVAKWIDQNAVEWAKYNGVSAEDIQKFLQ